MIFDCDGVLVDSEPTSARALAAALTEIGLPTSPEYCLRNYTGTWWPDCLAMIEARLGRPPPDGFTERYRARQNAALAEGVEPVPGVLEALTRIDAAVCVASNGTPQKMQITLERTGLLERFDGAIFSAEQVARGKPAPDLFLHVAEALGVKPGGCAVVEDSVIGIEAARAAGMRALGYSVHSDPTAIAAAGGEPFDSMAALPGMLGAPAARPGRELGGH